MNTLKQICEYTILVFGHWKSAITMMMFVILTIPTGIGLSSGTFFLPTWAWVILLLLFLYISGFFVYQEVVKKLPKPADLSVTCRLAGVQASAFSEMPLSPIRFTLSLELINRGHELATLVSLDIVRFMLNTDLIGEKPLRKKMIKTNFPHMHNPIYLPYNVEPGHRETNIVYEIEAGILSLDPLSFARRLSELQEYEMDIQYQYEGLDRSVHSGTIQIKESFDDFKKQVIESWKQRKRHDLIVEAKGI